MGYELFGENNNGIILILMRLPWDVTEYMKYYNIKRLHSANDNLSLVEFKNLFKKVSGLTWPVHF